MVIALIIVVDRCKLSIPVKLRKAVALNRSLRDKAASKAITKKVEAAQTAKENFMRSLRSHVSLQGVHKSFNIKSLSGK